MASTPSTPEVSIVPQRLKEAREVLGLTKGDVSDVLALEVSYLEKLESGAEPLQGYDAQRFARLYRRSVSWILGDDFDPPLPAELLNSVVELSETDREAVLKFARFLASDATSK